MWQNLSQDIAAEFAPLGVADEYDVVWHAEQRQAYARERAKQKRDGRLIWLRIKADPDRLEKKSARFCRYYERNRGRILGKIAAKKQQRRSGGAVQLELQFVTNRQEDTLDEYHKFLRDKQIVVPPTGFSGEFELNEKLYQFQRDIVAWALRRGRACLFADCGLGKTPMQLEWARVVAEETGGSVLILAPLAVSQQTVREGQKFGIEVHLCRSQADVKQGVNIANYEILHKFEVESFSGVVLDESSILKAYDSKTRNQIIEGFSRTPYRLACTATPAPNDHMELGNHAEFVGAMTRTEMLSMYFVHDGGDTSKWRLKGHAVKDFWSWVCSWAVMIRKPSDLGYDDTGYELPELRIHERIVKAAKPSEGMLFAMPAETLQEQRAARRASLDQRVAEVAAIVNAQPDESWLVWCELNDEGDKLTASIPGAIQIAGADKNEDKESRMLGFCDGSNRVLVSKSSICGFGMNLQHCANMAFVGLSHSYEQFYQAVRRCWRFGQTRPVNVHIVSTDVEKAVLDNIKRKEADAQRMAREMVANMRDLNVANVRGIQQTKDAYEPKVNMRVPSWLKTEAA